MNKLEKKIAKIVEKHGAKEVNEMAARIVQQPLGDPPAKCTPPKIWNPFINQCVDGIG